VSADAHRRLNLQAVGFLRVERGRGRGRRRPAHVKPDLERGQVFGREVLFRGLEHTLRQGLIAHRSADLVVALQEGNSDGVSPIYTGRGGGRGRGVAEHIPKQRVID
jgi:hypothetical protein